MAIQKVEIVNRFGTSMESTENWTPTITDLTANDWSFKLPVGVKVRWFK